MAKPPPRHPAFPMRAPSPWGFQTPVFDRALAAHHQRKLAEAEKLYGQVPPSDPRYAVALHHLGLIRQEANDLDNALRLIRQSVHLNPRDTQALVNLANLLILVNEPDEALALCDRALKQDHRHAGAWTKRGNALWQRKDAAAAVQSYDHAVALQPDLAEAWANRGTALRALGDDDAALFSFEQALKLVSSDAKLWADYGSVLHRKQRIEEALKCFDQAVALDPGDASSACLARMSMQQLGRWHGLEQRWQAELDAVRRNTHAIGLGFPMLSHPWITARELADCLRSYMADPPEAWKHRPFSPRPDSERLHIAYVSADFADHPLGRLMAGVFERHDRKRFEVTAIALEPMPASPFGRRLFSAFEHVIDVRQHTEEQIADLMRARNIDIAIDLMGHTRGRRISIFAHRSAPIQVNYLGYPGTTGAPYIDYIIGDRWVTPPEWADEFSEKIVRLPESFQANDNQRRIAPDTPSRASLGLPESGFVFCCLNNTYKITPMVFDIWMRLLAKVPGSVLWLLGETETVVRNLSAEARARGISPDRLVFAKRLPYEHYLAQYRQADLFLDTLPFNAGTTASDALWAGLPVLTQLGATFAGRMAASLLDAVGLPELITRSEQAYEAMALRLATEPGLLSGYRERLAANVPATTLFDTQRFTHHLERAYELMWQRHVLGLPPAEIDVPALEAAKPLNAAATST